MTINDTPVKEYRYTPVKYTTLDEARLELDDLQRRHEDIEMQLSLKKAKYRGVIVPDEEWRAYQDWKGRALSARTYVTRQIRETKHWIREKLQEDKAALIKSDSPHLIAQKTLYVINRLKEAASMSGYVLSEEDTESLRKFQAAVDTNVFRVK